MQRKKIQFTGLWCDLKTLNERNYKMRFWTQNLQIYFCFCSLTKDLALYMILEDFKAFNRNESWYHVSFEKFKKIGSTFFLVKSGSRNHLGKN